MKDKTFKCIICDKDKTMKQKALTIGDGKFTEYICKQCRNNNGSVIYGTDEELPHSSYIGTELRYIEGKMQEIMDTIKLTTDSNVIRELSMRCDILSNRLDLLRHE